MDDAMAAGVAAPVWHVLPGTTAAAIRQLAAGEEAARLTQALGLAWPEPLQVAGTDAARLAWRGPQEALALAREGTALLPLLEELAPGRHELALAVDLSEALAVVELEGGGIDARLAHLVDASAVPRAPGAASRARLADVAVLLLRLEPGRLWLVAERPLLPYVEDWLAYAREGAFGRRDEEDPP